MVTRCIFTALVALVAAQRLVELRKSSRNEEEIRARGGREHVSWQMPWMRLLHAGWLASMLVEVWRVPRSIDPSVAVPAFAIFATGQLLRLAAMHTLGWRWTVRVMTVPGMPPVRNGIYRIVSHPNYVGVALEIAALPLVGSAYLTSIAFSVMNGVLLRWRIRAEDAALRGAAGVRAVGIAHAAPAPRSTGIAHVAPAPRSTMGASS